MVGVEHDRRCAQGTVGVSDDGRSPTFPDDLDLQPLGSEQLRDGVCAGFHVRLVEGRQRHAGYPGERFEVLAQCGQKLGDPGLHGAQPGRVNVWGKNVIGHDCERTHPRASGCCR